MDPCWAGAGARLGSGANPAAVPFRLQQNPDAHASGVFGVAAPQMPEAGRAPSRVQHHPDRSAATHPALQGSCPSSAPRNFCSKPFVPGPSTSKDAPVRPRLASADLNGSDQQQLLPRVR
jgi:hypothetical protein